MAVRVPPVQVVEAFAGEATVTAAGKLSVKSRPVAATEFAVLSIVKVNVLSAPPAMVSGANALEKPGDAVIVVVSKSLSLAALLSVSVPLTDAELSISPTLPGAVTLIVIVGAAPTLKLARVQVTTPDDSPQLQPVPDALTKPTPAGRLSLTLTFVAVDGPALLTSSE